MQRYPMRARSSTGAACLAVPHFTGKASAGMPKPWFHMAGVRAMAGGVCVWLHVRFFRMPRQPHCMAFRYVLIQPMQAMRSAALSNTDAYQHWRMRALAVPHFTGKASAGMPKPWCHMAGVRAMAGSVCIRLRLSRLTNMRPLPTRKNGKQPS